MHHDQLTVSTVLGVEVHNGVGDGGKTKGEAENANCTMPCGGSAPRGAAQILLYFLPFLWICDILRQLLNQKQHFLTLFPGQRGQIGKKTTIHFHTELFQNFISGHK